MTPKYFLWAVIISLMLTLTLFGQKPLRWNKVFTVFVIFWIWLAASLIWSVNPYEAIQSLSNWTLIILTLFVFYQTFDHPNIIRKGIVACSVSVAIGITISFLQVYTSLFHPSHHILVLAGSSTFINIKFISHFCSIIFPLLIALYLSKTNQKEKFWLIVLGAIMILHFLILSIGAKVVWLSLIVDTYILALFFIRKWKFFKPIFLTSVVIGLSVVLFKTTSLYQTIQPGGISTTQQRLIFWKNTLRAIKDRPFFGWGLGNFAIVYPKYETHNDRLLMKEKDAFGPSQYINTAHNDFLQLGLETGIIGLFLFLLILFMTLHQMRSRMKGAQSRNERILLLSLFLAFINLLLIAFVYFPFGQPISSLLFSFVIALLLKPSSPKKSLSQYHPIASLGVCGSIIFILSTTGSYFMADWHWAKAGNKTSKAQKMKEFEKSLAWYGKDWRRLNTAARHYKKNNLQRTIELSAEALAINPYSSVSHYNMGLLHRLSNKPKLGLYHFQKAMDLSPDYTAPFHYLGIEAHDAGDMKKALELFKKAQTLSNPNIGDAYTFGAYCQFNLKDYLGAKQSLLEALYIDPFKIKKHLRFFHLIDTKIKKNKITEKRFESLRPIGQTIAFLKDANRKVRSTATRYLLSYPPNQLATLLEEFQKTSDNEYRFRLFYILSEKLPNEVTEDARHYITTTDTLTLKTLATKPLRIVNLSLRHLYNHSPDDLRKAIQTPMFPKNKSHQQQKFYDEFKNIVLFYRKALNKQRNHARSR